VSKVPDYPIPGRRKGKGELNMFYFSFAGTEGEISMREGYGH